MRKTASVRTSVDGAPPSGTGFAFDPVMRKLALAALAACSCAWAPEATSPPVHPASGSAPDADPSAAAARAVEAQRAPPEPESAGREGFTWWDADGDGVLTVDELTEIWIAHLDANRDGVIEPAEWPVG